MQINELEKGGVYRGQKYSLLLHKEDLISSNSNDYITTLEPWMYLGHKKIKGNVWYFHVMGPTSDGWIPLIDQDIKGLKKIC